MAKSIIKTEKMSYKYPDGTVALKDINIEISAGERIAIVGSNGAGKSTLFSHFNGISEPTTGLIKIDGEPVVYKKKELLKIRQTVGIVFQNPDDQLFAPTVIEDVAFGPMNLGFSDEEVDKRVAEALKLVRMTGQEKKAPHHLSGGQKKRVAIAGILAMRPEIMVLDEPTTGLDPKGVDEVMEILQMLNKEDMSIIIASHDVEMVTEFADRIFVLHDGEIIGQGTTEEIFNDPLTLKKAHLKPPKAAELLHLLKEGGIPVNIQLTVSGAYHEILHVLGAKSYHNLLHVVKNDLQHKLLHNLGENKYHEMLHIIEENQHSFELTDKE
jgi:cobalt/nickel transport system ATP-binding protein